MTSQFGWSFVEKIVLRVFPLFAYVTLAILLDPRDFGIVAAAAVVVFIGQTLADGAVGQYIVQRKSLNRNVLASSFLVVISLAFALTGLFILIAPHVARLWSYPELGPVIMVLSCRIALSGLFAVPQALLVRRQEFKSIAIVSLVSSLSSTTVAVGLAAFGFGVWSLVTQTLSMATLQLVLTWRYAGWLPAGRPQWQYIGESLRFGSANIGTNLVNTLSQRIDEILVMTALGPVALGLYSMAKRVDIVVGGVATNVCFQVMTTSLARLQEQTDQFRKLYTETYRRCAWLFLGLSILLCLNVTWSLPMFLGARWAQAGDVAAVLLFASAIHSVSAIDSAATIALGRPRRELLLSAGAAAVQAVLVCLALPYGLVAVAFASVGRVAVAAPIRMLSTSGILRNRVGTVAFALFHFSLISALTLLVSATLVRYLGWGHIALVVLSFAGLVVYCLSTKNDFREMISRVRGHVAARKGRDIEATSGLPRSN